MSEASCARCHSATDWKAVRFDHVSTKFPLVGKHVTVPCAECHKEQILAGMKSVKYQGVATECQSCHKDVHAAQFVRAGETKCESCHSPVAWRTLVFNHETQSVFQLTGAHKNVPCRSCHKEEKVLEQKVIRFKPLSIKCESCHQGVVK
jgi:hypothetical protein